MRVSGSSTSQQYERVWAQGSRLRSVITLTHPTAVLIFSGLTVLLAVLAEGRWPDAVVVLALVGSMAFGQATIGLTNEIADVELDRVTKPWRVLPTGLISIRTAATLAAVCWLVALTAAYVVSVASMVGLAIGVGIGVVYNVWLKRTAYSWVPYALAYPLIPVWVWLSLEKSVHEVMPVFLIAAPLAVSIHMINQLRDYEEDLGAGVQGLVQYLGKQRAIQTCFTLLILGLIPTLFLQVFIDPSGLPLLMFAAFVHWLLVVPLVKRYVGSPDTGLLRVLFRRVQISGPILLLAWIMSLT